MFYFPWDLQKREWRSILIENIIICNTNLHLSPSRKLPLWAALAYSILLYDFMKSQVVEMNEAKQPCARFWYDIYIHNYFFLCCEGFMIFFKNSI